MHALGVLALLSTTAALCSASPDVVFPSLPASFIAEWTYTSPINSFSARQIGRLGANGNNPNFFSWNIVTLFPGAINRTELYVLYPNSSITKGSWWNSPDVVPTENDILAISCAGDVTETGLVGLEVGFSNEATRTIGPGPAVIRGNKVQHWQQLIESKGKCTDVWLTLNGDPIPLQYTVSMLNSTGQCGDPLHVFEIDAFFPLLGPLSEAGSSLFSLPPPCAQPPVASPSPRPAPSSPSWTMFGVVAGVCVVVGAALGWAVSKTIRSRRKTQDYGALLDVLH